MNNLERLADALIEANRLFVITDEWLRKYATERNGYTRKQLSILGIDWPPTKNWRKSVIGREITAEQKSQFENARNVKRKKFKRRSGNRSRL